MTETQTFAASALVVAHPDDEALWFSSVLAEVSRVICCFEECADLPERGALR
jgi:LmbE family N-acetylglucosaminyl deacetylase